MTKKKCQSVSEPHSPSPGETFASPEESLLSPHRAFVVQFREETEGAPGHFAGRVEHLVSGRARPFYSPQELLAFLRQMVNTVEDKPP